MATFGKTTIGANAIDYNTGIKRGSKYYLPEAGTVTAISLYATNVSGNVKFAIYDDDGANGAPGTKIWADDVGQTMVNGWNTKNGLSVQLQPGWYWLCWMTSATHRAYYDSPGNRAWNTQNYTDPWPDSWGATNTGTDRDHSIYCAYTPSGAPIIKTWTALLNTSHVYLRHRFMKLSQTLRTLHAWTLPIPSFLKQWLATLQTDHVFTRPSRRIGYTQRLQPTHVFRRPARVIRFPASLQLTHLFSRPSRFMKLVERLTLGHAYFMAVSGAKKTRLFLVIGDLAIQLSND
jgi:hypothetical protein